MLVFGTVEIYPPILRPTGTGVWVALEDVFVVPGRGGNDFDVFCTKELVSKSLKKILTRLVSYSQPPDFNSGDPSITFSKQNDPDIASETDKILSAIQ